MLKTLLLASFVLVTASSRAAAPIPQRDTINPQLVQARRAAAERFAFRLFGDFLLGHKVNVDRIGPALRRMFEADLACAESAAERLVAAERYNRIVHRFWRSEKHFRDTGQVADADVNPQPMYYARDAAVQVFKARRANGDKGPIGNEFDKLAAPDFSWRILTSDVLVMVVCAVRGFESVAKQQEDDGAVPLPVETIRALEQFPAILTARQDDELAQLLIGRCEAAGRELSLRCKVFQAGAKGGTLDRLFDSLRLRLTAELELSAVLSDQVKAHERALAIAKAIEQINERRFRIGQISDADLELSRYHRLDQQIGFLRAKNRLEGGTKKPSAERK